MSRKYSNAIIAFDEYENGPSIKDMTHIRGNRIQGREVVFSLYMKLTLRKDEFLSNTKNKARFVCDLLTHFREHGFAVLQAGGDADVNKEVSK